MALDKSRTPPIVKIGIILIAVVLVLGVGGASIMPLLEAVLVPSTTTNATTKTTETTASITADYSQRVKVLGDELKTDPKNYDMLVAQAQTYREWASKLSVANETSTTTGLLWRSSIDYYQRALTIKPSDPNVRTDLASTRFYSGDITGGISDAEAVAKSDPKFASVHFFLGNFYAGLGDSARGLSEYQKCVTLDPKGQFASQAKTQIDTLKKQNTSTAPPGAAPGGAPQGVPQPNASVPGK